MTILSTPLSRALGLLFRVTAALAVLAPARVVSAQLPAPAVSAPTPVHVGGYASVVVNATRLGDSTRVTESSAALLVSGTLASRVTYFGELDAVNSSRENYAGRQNDRTLDVARLYAEVTFADAARLRVGRFLTPVGQWNENPAEPLTWTAVRPLSTYRPFAKSATGVLLAGNHAIGGHDAGYALYGTTSTNRDNSEVRFKRALGGRVALELLPGLWIGGSGASVAEVRPYEAEDDSLEVGEGEGGTEPDGDEIDDQRARALFGADLQLRIHGVELLAEAVSLSSNENRSGQRGAFAQAAIPTGVPGLAVVGRAEWYEPPAGAVTRSGSIGLTFRTRDRLTLKLERQRSDSPSPRLARGWFAAVSLLF